MVLLLRKHVGPQSVKSGSGIGPFKWSGEPEGTSFEIICESSVQPEGRRLERHIEFSQIETVDKDWLGLRLTTYSGKFHDRYIAVYSLPRGESGSNSVGVRAV